MDTTSGGHYLIHWVGMEGGRYGGGLLHGLRTLFHTTGSGLGSQGNADRGPSLYQNGLM